MPFFKFGSFFGSGPSAPPQTYSSSHSSHRQHSSMSAAPPSLSRRSSARESPVKPTQRRAQSYQGSAGTTVHFQYSDAGRVRPSVERPVYTQSRRGSFSSDPGRSSHRGDPNKAYLTPSSSNSSIYTMPGASSHRRSSEPRPILKHNPTWPVPQGSSSGGPHVKMHPILAYSHSQPTIAYNTLSAPSNSTVLHPSTRVPISSHTLNLPATSPATTQLTLSSPYLPWPIVVKSPTSARHAITNLDVLQALHAALRVPVSKDEWASLGTGSRAQQKVADAYEKRCAHFGNDWENGVRRSDWLSGRTVFVGVEGKSDGSLRIVLGR